MKFDDDVLMVDRLKSAILSEREKNFVFQMDMALLKGIPISFKQKQWLKQLEADHTGGNDDKR
jgi:hypothetical protein